VAHTIKRSATQPRMRPVAERPRTVTLFAVRLEAVREAWLKEPIARAAAAFPRGRLAAMAGPPAAPPLDTLDAHDRAEPPSKLVLSLSPPQARHIWDALLEDRAAAALYDAPSLTLAEVFAAIAKVAGRRELESMHLEQSAEPAYPPELLEPAGASGPMSVGGRISYLVWMGNAEAATARTALASALTLPVGAFTTASPELRPMFRDLAESLLPVLEAAARPRHSLVATRS
jgi:hypothetical protein